MSSRLPDPPDSLADGRRVIAWMREVQRIVEVELVALRTKKQGRGEEAYLRPVTVATLPPPAPAGKQVYVTDESGGAVPAFSDGLAWRRVTDRAVVS